MISKERVLLEDRLIDLLKKEALLEELQAYGVDNWSGWGMWYDEDPDWDAGDIAREQLKFYPTLPSMIKSYEDLKNK